MVSNSEGMFPPHPCKGCGKTLNADGGHPAELYAGTYTGLCYACQDAKAFKLEDCTSGAATMSHPPHCPSWRRDREVFHWFSDCRNPKCDQGRVMVLRPGSQGGSYAMQCDECLARHLNHPATKERVAKEDQERKERQLLFLKRLLVHQADASHVNLPQYKGHWDGDNWVVVACKRDVSIRGVKVASKGQPYLMNKDSLVVLTAKDTDKKSNIGKTFAVFYLPENFMGCDTRLRVDYFEPYLG